MVRKKSKNALIFWVIALFIAGLFIGSSLFGTEFDKQPILSYDAVSEDLCTPDNAGAWVNSLDVVECKSIGHLLNSQVRCVCELG